MSLRARLMREAAAVGVMGLGYVGLQEAVDLARAGLQVTGFDIDPERVRSVQQGRSHVVDVSDQELAAVVGSGRLSVTGDFGRLGAMDAVLICVPTPLSKTKTPDLSYVISAVEAIRSRLRRGQLVVLESTTYPGTTSEVLLPSFESTGLKVGEDFHLCFSPERLNPGDREHAQTKIPRIIGGVTAACAEVAAGLYRRISPEVVVVDSAQAAEMVKLLENTFRAVNIGLVNEFALMCRAFGLDVWHIIDAAATKPFGFMPFYPGPGLGGHCIPIDPLYLSWKARAAGFEPRFIDLAHHVNSGMPHVVVSIVMDALNDRGRSLKGASVLVLGVGYKRDINDVRESPALDVIADLGRRGARVRYHDPYVPAVTVAGERFTSVPLEDGVLQGADAVVIVTDHTTVDYKRVVELAPLVVDTRNATRGVIAHRDNVVRL
jgi:UDP-N-acetyl-D-glucosamine dehydrogenase